MNATHANDAPTLAHRRRPAPTKKARPGSTEVRCPSCNQAYRIPAAGLEGSKRIRCRRCSGIIRLRPARTHAKPAATAHVRIRREPRRRMGGPVGSDPITIWHWISAVLLVGVIIALLL